MTLSNKIYIALADTTIKLNHANYMFRNPEPLSRALSQPIGSSKNAGFDESERDKST
jgi:hypothetical protein